MMEVYQKVKIMYGIGIGSLDSISFIGYMILLQVFIRNPSIKKNYKYLMSLAISDICVMVHCGMAVAACFVENWPFGVLGCTFSAWVAGAFTFISLNSIPLVAKGRYFAAIGAKDKDVEILKDIFSVWIGGGIMAMLPFFGFGKYGCESTNENMKVTCFLDFQDNDWKCSVYVVILFFTCFLRPVVRTIQYYSKASAKDKNCGKMMYLVPLHLVICFTPYATFATTATVFGMPDLPWFAVPMCNICAKLFVAGNPFIYSLNDPVISPLFKKQIGSGCEPEEEQKKAN